MNKNIFLTLAAALIAGAVLYKMPSRAGGDTETTNTEQASSSSSGNTENQHPLSIPKQVEQEDLKALAAQETERFKSISTELGKMIDSAPKNANTGALYQVAIFLAATLTDHRSEDTRHLHKWLSVLFQFLVNNIEGLSNNVGDLQKQVQNLEEKVKTLEAAVQPTEY